MIEIDIQDKSKEQVKFGGVLYNVDFSDAKQQEYVAAYEKITKQLNDLNDEYEKLSKDKASGDDLAKKSVEMLKLERDESIRFIDLIFGSGEGQKIYEKCGSSTEYLSQKVSELATAISLKRENERRNEIKAIRDKYLPRRNNKR